MAAEAPGPNCASTSEDNCAWIAPDNLFTGVLEITSSTPDCKLFTSRPDKAVISLAWSRPRTEVKLFLVAVSARCLSCGVAPAKLLSAILARSATSAIFNDPSAIAAKDSIEVCLAWLSASIMLADACILLFNVTKFLANWYAIILALSWALALSATLEAKLASLLLRFTRLLTLFLCVSISTVVSCRPDSAASIWDCIYISSDLSLASTKASNAFAFIVSCSERVPPPLLFAAAPERSAKVNPALNLSVAILNCTAACLPYMSANFLAASLALFTLLSAASCRLST